MCDIKPTLIPSTTTKRSDNFIGLKVAITELSKNFDSLNLPDDDTILKRPKESPKREAAQKLLTSIPEPKPEADDFINVPTPTNEEAVCEGEGESDTEEEKEGSKSTEPPKEEQKLEKKKKKKKKRTIGICTVNCRYESVRRVSKRYGFKEVGENEDWVLFWTDCSVNIERVMDMKRYQKINHFPGMSEICRKDLLARNMNRMQKLFPKEYNICPRSWCLPADYSEFMAYHRTKKNKTYIIKPDNSCQGKGIMLTKTPKVDIKHCDNFVVQQYLSKPFLVDSLKFDLRIYVLVTSCDPLRIYVYKDGLVRFAVNPYQDPNNSNVDDVLMHLTNYAITKHSSAFIRDDERGHKRKITQLNKWFDMNGYNKEKIWADIEDVIIKTLIVSHPTLKHNYRTCFPNHNRGSACFEILGFDIMLDRKLKPWLLEVNHSPSFHTDAPLDKDIKEGFLADTIKMLNCSYLERKRCIEEDRRRVKERLFAKSGTRQQQAQEMLDSDKAYSLILEQFEVNNCGGFRSIFPCANEAKYRPFFQHSGSLFTETVASKARQECARLQREAIAAKQNEGRPKTKTADAGETGESMGKQRKVKKKIRPVPERLYKRPYFKMDTLPPGSPRVPIYMTTAVDAPTSTIDPISAKIDALEKATPKKNFFEEASKLRHLTFEKARENIIIKMPSMTLNPKEDYLKVRCYLGPTIAPENSSSFYPGMFKFLTRDPATVRGDLSKAPWDSGKPIPITEEEELDRLSGMIERDNLVRGLGMSELITEMLQSAKVTTKGLQHHGGGGGGRLEHVTTQKKDHPAAAERSSSSSTNHHHHHHHGASNTSRNTYNSTANAGVPPRSDYPVVKQRLWQHRPASEAPSHDHDADKGNRLLNRGITPPHYMANSGSDQHVRPVCSVYSLPSRSNNSNVNLSVVSGPAPVTQRTDQATRLGQDGTARTTRSSRVRGATNVMRLKQLSLRSENNAIPS